LPYAHEERKEVEGVIAWHLAGLSNVVITLFDCFQISIILACYFSFRTRNVEEEGEEEEDGEKGEMRSRRRRICSFLKHQAHEMGNAERRGSGCIIPIRGRSVGPQEVLWLR
jgi:hypothetical protein